MFHNFIQKLVAWFQSTRESIGMSFRSGIKKLIAWLQGFVPITDEDLVRSLVLNTAALELERDHYVEFAPIQGTCGTFKCTGNSLPTFTYTVFEKKIMEFIEVRVEVARPDRIQFLARIKSTDKAQDGKDVEVTERYKAPFMKLAHQLYQYYPFPRKGGVVQKHGTIQEQPGSTVVQIQNTGT